LLALFPWTCVQPLIAATAITSQFGNLPCNIIFILFYALRLSTPSILRLLTIQACLSKVRSWPDYRPIHVAGSDQVAPKYPKR
jgi:hypothetical protein